MRRATGAISSGLAQRAISIHALHEERDRLLKQNKKTMRRATVSAINKTPKLAISIHALHEESDGTSTGQILQNLNFNPRSP